MAVTLDDCILVGIVNPNTHCTQINYMPKTDGDMSQKALILFDQQIKYIEVEEYSAVRRVRVYVRGEETPINIDIPSDEVELYDLFLRSLYNK